nr:unnamed protein product [Spirometra erinaceieuropaei]
MLEVQESQKVIIRDSKGPRADWILLCAFEDLTGQIFGIGFLLIGKQIKTLRTSLHGLQNPCPDQYDVHMCLP